MSKTLSGSVVASIKIICSGGSSKVLRKAFEAALESMWTSSKINTLFFPGLLAIKFTLSFISRMSSTLLCDAASISDMSKIGSQPSCKAIILANDVLPTPLGPEKRYACPRFSLSIWLLINETASSCPTNSDNFVGLYFL